MVSCNKFEKWFNETPEIFRKMVLNYVTPYKRELFRVMEKSDPDGEARMLYGISIDLLRRMYNDGVFGELEKTL